MKPPHMVAELVADRAITSLPEVWIDLAHGRITHDEALRLASQHEPAELAERSARLLAPPPPARAEAQLQALLDAHFPVRRIRSRRWIYTVVATLAAAVLVVLGSWILPSLEPDFVAHYDVELGRALALARDGGPAASGPKPRYLDGRAIEITLRPKQRVTVPVDVRAFATDPHQRSHALPITPTINAHGVIRFLGDSHAWGLGAGEWQLTFVVGRRGEVPDALPSIRRDGDARLDVQTVSIDIVENTDDTAVHR